MKALQRYLFLGLLALGCAAPVLAAGQVTDQNGKEVQLPARVQRLVAIPIPLASMVMAVDGGVGRLSGINAAARSDIDEGLLGRMFPAAAQVPAQVAGENFVPNGEALAAARPDLVIQWGDRGDAIVAPIRNLGLPVLTLRYGDSLLAAGWLRLTGQALGKPERGEALARWFEGRVAELERRGAAIPEARRPRVLYLMRARSALQVAGKGTSMDGDIRRAGGINPAAGLPGFAQVGVEQILAWNPDVILLNNFEPGLNPETLFRDSRFTGVKALSERRVYLYPRGGFRWDPPSQETPLAVDWLFSVLHPGQGEPGLRQRIVAAYRELYGYPLSEADLDQLLRLKENGSSARYRELLGQGR